MTKIQNTKQYDLEDRTLKFTRKVREYIKKLPKTVMHPEISQQLFRSAGSVGANYIEANESFSKRDFIMRVKICRKEVKESRYWLDLSEANKEKETDKKILMDEATQLMKIFGAIIEKCK